MKIEVRRSKRKSITLKVLDSQNAILCVPMKTTQAKIDSFLTSKRGWLENTVKKMQQNEAFAKNFELENCAYINGQKVCEWKEIFSGFDKFSAAKQKREIKKFYISKFSELERRVGEISAKTSLPFSGVEAISSVRLWGSFDSKKHMKLNFKLVILPRHLADYVIVHELCHGKFMNHSPKFWAAVKRILPDAQIRRKELSKYSFLLRNKSF